jgi:hypothetical protein
MSMRMILDIGRVAHLEFRKLVHFTSEGGWAEYLPQTIHLDTELFNRHFTLCAES